MKIKITLKHILSSILLFSGFVVLSQTQEQREKIISKTDTGRLMELSSVFSKEFKENKEKALAMATIKGWPLTMQNSDGSFAELQGILENGNPLYFTTYNTGAASTSKINSLNTGGSLGLNLNGQNMIVGVWDQNVPLITHTDFGGRIIILDGSSVQTSFHSTHVTGTVLGAGTTNAPSKGMAFQSAGYILDWNNDYAEMSFEAGFGLLLSNHSYGQIATQLSEFQFGAYVSRSRQLDEIAFAAPYYLSVHAAGNDRNDNNQTVNPTKGGYDLLNGNKTSKNTLVVAAVNQVTNYTGPSSVAISSFSSYGPTDDNRVKPDISAKGVNVISTSNASISSHGPSSGTSMASPVVTGGLLLIQQHYSNLNQGNFMKSSSLRGLACHTADEAGAWDGPDPIYGWGLFNAEKAAQLITNKAAGLSIIDERTLNQGQTYTKVVNATGNAPLEVTICWTDRPGAINSGVVDSSTPVLVNNLDVRILKNDVVHFPWRLGNSHTDEAIRADNNVDNIEKVEIDNASGEYTIVVSHKGNLTGGSQEYALLVSGINENLSLDTVNTNNFSLTPNPVSDRLVVNSNQLYESNIICYIYDLQGRLVDTFNADFTQDSTYEIDVTSLSSGVYVLKAQGDDVQFSKKFVKK